MTPEVLTPRQVSEIFAVHPATVKSWADDGRLAGFKTPGGHWRFRRTDVDRLLHDGTPTPKTAPTVAS